MIIVNADHVAATPWRNGGGRTRELLAWPSGEAWQVRISLADIERDGPFSPFPGVVRWFAVLEGAGVELHLDGAWRRVQAGDAPLCFDGAAAPGCRLVDGPTRDLNLMLRACRGRLEAADGANGQQAAGLFAARSGALGGRSLAARSLAWFDTGDRPAERRFRPDAPPAIDPAAPAGWWVHLDGTAS